VIALSKNTYKLSYSLVIPFLSDSTLVPFLLKAKVYDFSHVKVKIDKDSHVSRVKKVREHLGDAIEIRVDANAALDPLSIHAIADELKGLGVVAIEQPYSVTSLDHTSELRSLGLLDVVLDESVVSPEDVTVVTDAGACDIVNVRISKCGGLLGALRVVRAARKNGLRVQLGAQVGESCILSAAGALLASALDDFMWLEGSFGRHLLLDDICEDSVQFGKNGLLSPPDGPGMGITICNDRLDEAHRKFSIC